MGFSSRLSETHLGAAEVAVHAHSAEGDLRRGHELEALSRDGLEGGETVATQTTGNEAPLTTDSGGSTCHPRVMREGWGFRSTDGVSVRGDA